MDDYAAPPSFHLQRSRATRTWKALHWANQSCPSPTVSGIYLQRLWQNPAPGRNNSGSGGRHTVYVGLLARAVEGCWLLDRRIVLLFCCILSTVGVFRTSPVELPVRAGTIPPRLSRFRSIRHCTTSSPPAIVTVCAESLSVDTILESVKG